MSFDIGFYLSHAAQRIDESGGRGATAVTRLASVGDPAIEEALARLEPVRARLLRDVEFALDNPLLAHLFHQLGLATGTAPFFSPDVQRTPEGRTYAVLHVRDVTKSEYVARIEELLVAHGVRSALAFGGKLSRGDAVAVVIYSRIAIPDDSAEQFRTVALDLTALFRSREGLVFAR